MKTIVLLGDSHLARTREDAGEALIPKFSQDLPNIRILNLAKGGVNTSWGLETIRKSDFSLQSMALVMFGTNDAAPWKQIPIDQFTNNYRSIIFELKNKNVTRIILITPPPVNVSKQQPPGRSNELLAQYSQVVKQVAVENKLACIDLFSILSEAMKTTDVHYEDGVHLNSAGYNILFGEIKKELKN